MDGIVLFGGSGYIGSNLIFTLQKDFNIVIVDKAKEPPLWIERLTTNVEYYCINLLKTPVPIPKPRCNPRYAIILAALKHVTEAEELPFMYIRDNLTITTNCLEYCSMWGIRDIIFSSSCAIYNTFDNVDSVQPFTEEDDKDLPLGIYGYTKRASEDIVSVVARNKKNLRAAILRYTNPVSNVTEYLPFPQAGVMSILANKPTHFEHRVGCRRDYLNMKDLTNMHLLLLKHWDEKVFLGATPLVLNIGCGISTDTSVVVDFFKKLNPNMIVTETPRSSFEMKEASLNISRFRNMFPEWKPLYTLEDTMKEYVTASSLNRYLKVRHNIEAP